LANDLQTITEVARDLAYRQLDSQFQASDNFDAKAIGVLGFDGAALAAILAGKDLFHKWWGIPAVVVMISAVFAILTIRSFRSWDKGPDAGEFYEAAIKGGTSEGSAAKANVDLLSELVGPDGSIAKNKMKLDQKSRFFLLALGAAVMAGATSAILIGLTTP
jgi:hypothetical protein